MTPFTTTILSPVLAAAVFTFGPGCQPLDEGDAGGQSETDSAAIRNGTILQPWPSGTNQQKSVLQVPGCSATLIRPDWVLTAKHCGIKLPPPPAAGMPAPAPLLATSPRPGGPVTRKIDAVINALDPSDITLLHLERPFTDVPVVELHRGPVRDVYGRPVDAFGFGAIAGDNACTTNAECAMGGTCVNNVCSLVFPNGLRGARLIADRGEGYGPETFNLLENGLRQQILRGDSGGPTFLNGRQIGVHSMSGVDMSITSLMHWIETPSRVAYVPGDFNGDRKRDFIAVTPSGSKWYYATGVGKFDVAYTRNDLKLGEVKYTTGNFNGDSMTDLIITTKDGSWFYYATGTGTFRDVESRTSEAWKLGRREFYVGNFDGDQFDDFILSASVDGEGGGSFPYYSRGAQGFDRGTGWPTLSWGQVSFVTGDFDRDQRDDVIMTTSAGSSWLYSDGRDRWTSGYVRTDLRLGEVRYTVANFDGLLGKDLIITTPNGSWWYYAGARGQWTEGYHRSDLTWENTRYTTGDFDGDRRDDVIITTASGSYWYYSDGVGRFSEKYVRTDLPRNQGLFAVGDFNDDLKSDVIVLTDKGSTWKYSTGRGTWNDAYKRTDLAR